MVTLAGMFGWVKGSGLFSKMVEKTRSVTTNVITTLDPQMKEFIQSGGDIQVPVLDLGLSNFYFLSVVFFDKKYFFQEEVPLSYLRFYNFAQ
jgi:hypothetical protein